MLKPSISQGWRIAGGVGAALLLLIVAGLWRIASGPIAMDWLKPTLERTLAAQVSGGRARLAQVSLVWFPQERSLGLRLDGLRLDDGRGRSVARARRLEAALALDALPGFKLAPGRISADQFFAAVSVSPQGRYALGYDASGAPSANGRPSEFDRLLLDLTGKPKFGRALSYIRTVDLEDGRVALRQVGGGAAWVADVRRLNFRKTHRMLAADADVQLEGGAHPATLKASGRAASAAPRGTRRRTPMASRNTRPRSPTPPTR